MHHGPDRRTAPRRARCARRDASRRSPRRSRASAIPRRASAQRGYATLLRTIVGQQVSVAAGRRGLDASWRRRWATRRPASVAAASDEALRAARPVAAESGYARSLADEVTSGRLDLARAARDDEEAIAALVRVKGIGRWSAEIYLLFAEGRADIWPAGDLAVQIEVGRILGHESRPPREKRARGRGLAPASRRGGDLRLAQLYEGRFVRDLSCAISFAINAILTGPALIRQREGRGSATSADCVGDGRAGARHRPPRAVRRRVCRARARNHLPG